VAHTEALRSRQPVKETKFIQTTIHLSVGQLGTDYNWSQGWKNLSPGVCGDMHINRAVRQTMNEYGIILRG